MTDFDNELAEKIKAVTEAFEASKKADPERAVQELAIEAALQQVIKNYAKPEPMLVKVVR